jgi:hypothetical protein
MKIHESTKLWQSTLGRRQGCDPDEAMRDRFRQSLIQFRDRAEQLAHSIPHEIRQLTVHDVPHHIDALWQIADIVVGDTYVLSAAEGYVLVLQR